MDPSDYKNTIKHQHVQDEIVKRLRSLPDTDRFEFLLALMQVNLSHALRIANRCLHVKAHFERIFELGMQFTERVAPSQIPDRSPIRAFLSCVIPRIGARRVIMLISKSKDSYPYATAHAYHFLPEFIFETDKRAMNALKQLQQSPPRTPALKYLKGSQMDESTFLEIVMNTNEIPVFERQDIEDSLNDALQEARIGEVTGGGSGLGSCNIDVEVQDVQRALEVIRRTLREMDCSSATTINQYKPKRIVYRIE